MAESENYQNATGQSVSTTLATTNNDWEITVTYCLDGCNTWFPYVIATIVVLSLCISILVYTIFTQKQFHNDALAEKQAQMVSNARKAARNERELNDFIAHEVRNPLAAALYEKREETIFSSINLTKNPYFSTILDYLKY